MSTSITKLKDKIAAQPAQISSVSVHVDMKLIEPGGKLERNAYAHKAPAVVLVGNSLAQTGPPPQPPHPLGEVNTLFLKEYLGRIDTITRMHSLYVEVSGDNLILHRNGQEESKRVLPDIYHALKNVSHVPLLLYLRLAPLSSSRQISETGIAGLQTLSAKISAARDALWTNGFNDVQRIRQLRIMDRSLVLLHSTVNAKRIPRPTLEGYAHSMAPLLLANAEEGACYAIDEMHAQMMRWKSSLTANEWKRLVVINPGVFQPRYRSLATQYFAWLFPAPAPPWAYPGENERVIYSEFQHPHRDSGELLASTLIDADASTAFFGNKWRLSEDLLSDGAVRCIARLPKSDQVWRAVEPTQANRFSGEACLVR